MRRRHSVDIYTLRVQASLRPHPISRDNHLFHLIDEEPEAQRGGDLPARKCEGGAEKPLLADWRLGFYPLPSFLTSVGSEENVCTPSSGLPPSFCSQTALLFPIHQLLSLFGRLQAWPDKLLCSF